MLGCSDDVVCGGDSAADEVCDGKDNDCDGFVDEAAVDGVGSWRDADGDGYGNPAMPVATCQLFPGLVGNASDCDDTRDDISPAEDESCNGRDDNCDGLIDDATALADSMTIWYEDVDGDGYGDDNSAWVACDAPVGSVWSEDGGDCGPDDPSVYPKAEEQCGDGVDSDCDGSVAECPASPLIIGTIWGTDEGAALGHRLRVLGDVDGDGADDLLATTEADSGASSAYLLPAEFAGEANVDDVATAWLQGPAPSVLLGAAGDVDGDGNTELGLIRDAYGMDVSFWSAPVAGDLESVAAAVVLSSSRASIGAFDASADLDGDGIVDVLAGASEAGVGGEVYLLLGPSAGERSVDDADGLIIGDEDDNLGPADGICVVGDVDADGLPDIALGASSYGSAGATGLFLGIGAGERPFSSADALLIGTDESADRPVAVGDLDADLVPDLGVVAADPYGSDAAVVAVFYLPVSGSVDVGHAPFRFTESLMTLGVQPLSAGDFDADGARDVVLGSYRDGTVAHESLALFLAPEDGSFATADATMAPVADYVDDDEADNVAPTVAVHTREGGDTVITNLQTAVGGTGGVTFLRVP